MARLVVTREEADLVTHELTRDIVTIGSAPLNHIVMSDCSCQNPVIPQQIRKTYPFWFPRADREKTLVKTFLASNRLLYQADD